MIEMPVFQIFWSEIISICANPDSGTYCARKVFTKPTPVIMTSIGLLAYPTHTSRLVTNGQVQHQWAGKVFTMLSPWPWPLTCWPQHRYASWGQHTLHTHTHRPSLVTIRHAQHNLLHSQGFYKVCSSNKTSQLCNMFWTLTSVTLKSRSNQKPGFYVMYPWIVPMIKTLRWSSH
jgi:hypothetical protein